MSSVKKHRCIRCNKLFDEKDIEFSPDPYAEEVAHDITFVWECKRCRQESADDI